MNLFLRGEMLVKPTKMRVRAKGFAIVDHCAIVNSLRMVNLAYRRSLWYVRVWETGAEYCFESTVFGRENSLSFTRQSR